MWTYTLEGVKHNMQPLAARLRTDIGNYVSIQTSEYSILSYLIVAGYSFTISDMSKGYTGIGNYFLDKTVLIAHSLGLDIYISQEAQVILSSFLGEGEL